MRWDLFCRVIDNFGDIGVCWRLARDLASRGETVRLWVDDASALAWMAPGGAAGVTVGAFDAASEAGEVVIEAFGCDPPPVFVESMARRAPVWINLEYLSAEDYVERSHALPSPQPGGLTKWFYFPGFTGHTGGLLREPGLLREQAGFDRNAWLAARGWAPRPGERVASLFCYEPRPQVLAAWADQPTLLLRAPGAAQQPIVLPPAVRSIALPWLSQRDYDRLLWSCDLNFVRGEDSLVRAVWADRPFVWQIYPQHDGVHADKLQALLGRLPPVAGLAALWQAWNGLRADAAWPDDEAWRSACHAFRARLAEQPDLTSGLLQFVHGKQARAC